MGGTYSVDSSSLLGKTVIKKYKTTKLTYILIKKDKIKLQNGPSCICNPSLGNLELRVKPGLEFEILEIKKDWNFELGYSFEARIKFLNSPQLEEHLRKAESYLISIPDKDNEEKIVSTTEWKQIDLKEEISKTFSDLIVEREGILYLSSFFKNLPNKDENEILKPITMNDSIEPLI